MRRELVDDGSAGIAEAEELRDFVVGLARGIVARFAEQAIVEAFAAFRTGACGLR